MRKWMNRLKEPSTYASLAAVLALTGVKVDPGWIEAAATLGAGVAAVLGIVLKETGRD